MKGSLGLLGFEATAPRQQTRSKLSLDFVDDLLDADTLGRAEIEKVRRIGVLSLDESFRADTDQPKLPPVRLLLDQGSASLKGEGNGVG